MQKDFEIDLAKCISCMQTNGIFLYPTDTVWGLGADATDEVAVQHIMHLKNRPTNKSFVVLVADQQQLSEYVSRLEGQILELLQQFEKPTTVIYPDANGFAPTVMAPDGSAAIRICKDAFCEELLRRSGKPLLSTSANLSGQPAPAIFSEIDPVIIKGVDYVVKYRQKDQLRTAPSTIIRWQPARIGATGEKGNIEIIRP